MKPPLMSDHSRLRRPTRRSPSRSRRISWNRVSEAKTSGDGEVSPTFRRLKVNDNGQLLCLARASGLGRLFPGKSFGTFLGKRRKGGLSVSRKFPFFHATVISDWG